MVATLTFASASQPRSVADVSSIEGYQAAPLSTYSGGVSATGAVHFQSNKIPHGATITDVLIWHKQDQSTVGFCHTVGIAGGITSAALFGSESFSTTTRLVSMMRDGTGTVGPYKVSISDDVATRYVYPTVTTTATGTNSISISIGVLVRWSMNKSNAAGQ